MSEGPRFLGAATCAAALLGGGLLFAAAGLLVAGGSVASAAPQSSQAAPHCGGGAAKLTVTGSATVTVTPDVLRFSVDMHTTGPQAATALSANDTVTTSVIHALETQGLTSSDVQTTDLTIQPNYTNTGADVTGYSVDDTIQATVHDLGDAGSLIDTAVNTGGNAARVESVALSLTHPIRAQNRARSLAVHQAVAHARAMAKAAGERLGGICSVRDDSPTSTTTPVTFSATAGLAAPTHRSPIEAGTQNVTGRVSLVFGLE